jgi:hypothetical protein
MSGSGANVKCGRVRYMVAIGGKAGSEQAALLSSRNRNAKSSSQATAGSSTTAKAKGLGAAPTTMGVPGWLFEVRIGVCRLVPPVT